MQTEGQRKGYQIHRRRACLSTHLKAEGLIAGYKITHRKPGLDPAHLSEFGLVVETEGLTQLDEAFRHVSSSTYSVESFHHAVNSLVKGPFSRSIEISRRPAMSAARSVFNPLRAKREGSSGGYSTLN